jgi:hypothetical protein
MSNNQSVVIPESTQKDMDGLPGILSFQHLYGPLGLKTVAAAYRRFERGTLGVRVGEYGGKLGVLKLDLALYLATGQTQHQPPIKKRDVRNPVGRFGKAGRKTNAGKDFAAGSASC